MTFKEWLPLIDTSGNGRVTKKELKTYFKTYVEGKCTGEEKPEMIACSTCKMELEKGTMCPKCFYTTDI